MLMIVYWKHLSPHENERMRQSQIYVHKNEEGRRWHLSSLAEN